jgi:hypothetical protein
MSYRGCIPYGYGIDLAKSYLEKDLWVGLAGGGITWVDEEATPYPSRTFTTFSDLEALVYIDKKRLVRLNPLGEIEADGVRFSYVNPNQDISNLVTQEAFYLYLEASIPTDSILPTDTYKLISLLYDVEFTTPPIKEKYSIIQSTTVMNYKVMWLGTSLALELNLSERKLQFIRPFK